MSTVHGDKSRSEEECKRQDTLPLSHWPECWSSSAVKLGNSIFPWLSTGSYYIRKADGEPKCWG